MSDNNNALSNLENYILSDNENFTNNNSGSEMAYSNSKRKDNEITNKNMNRQKKILQDLQKKIDVMYLDWKADSISQAIYSANKKVKYLDDECLMKTQQFCHQAQSNIVQHIKDSIHTKFNDLPKSKTKNRQIMHNEERRFKNTNIIRECYMRLNKPVNTNDDPNYIYFNLIIDNTFMDPKTEKNSIAFGIAVILNYLDPSKGFNMVLSEIVERMNYFLEKIQVPEREELS
ncbi:6019_t:CDS:2 [Racocetra persica]|uniref:6019_t:CDS:1 n=1 Tax=Racocetra persica TaxID=160502 RepID=A0ACA9N1F0_9GLOM|nr:6019_t:CDS:2 [Racocetra persica]